MKKRPYRAVSVNSLDLTKLHADLGGRPMIMAVDVAKTNMVAVLCSETGEIRKTIRWKHPDDFGALVALLRGLESPKLEVVLESTSTYGDALSARLREQGASIFVVHTKHTRDAREMFDGVPSQHDGKCAAIIAELHRNGKSRPQRVLDAEQRQARALQTERAWYSGQFETHRGRLEAFLGCYWPEATRFANLDGIAFLTLLRDVGAAQEVAVDPDGAYRLLAKVSRSRHSAENARALIESAATTIGIVPIAQELKALKTLAGAMLSCHAEIREIDKQIRAYGAGIAEVAAMASVVGWLAALVLFSAVGRPKQYDSAGAWLKAAGLNLTEKSSGRDPKSIKHVPVSLSKRGSPEVRRLLYLASLRIAQNDPIIALWLQGKAERDGGRKLPGQIAIMRKLMRALWHIGCAAQAADKLDGEAKEHMLEEAVYRTHRLFRVQADGDLPQAA